MMRHHVALLCTPHQLKAGNWLITNWRGTQATHNRISMNFHPSPWKRQEWKSNYLRMGRGILSTIALSLKETGYPRGVGFNISNVIYVPVVASAPYERRRFRTIRAFYAWPETRVITGALLNGKRSVLHLHCLKSKLPLSFALSASGDWTGNLGSLCRIQILCTYFSC